VEVVVVGELLELHAAVVMRGRRRSGIAAMPRRSRPGRPEKGGRLMGPNCRHEAGVPPSSSIRRGEHRDETGDSGQTSLLYGGRVRKDSARIDCNGAVDEAQSSLGLARAFIRAGAASGPPPFSTEALVEIIVGVERDLWGAHGRSGHGSPPSDKARGRPVTGHPGMVEALTALCRPAGGGRGDAEGVRRAGPERGERRPRRGRTLSDAPSAMRSP